MTDRPIHGHRAAQHPASGQQILDDTIGDTQPRTNSTLEFSLRIKPDRRSADEPTYLGGERRLR